MANVTICECDAEGCNATARVKHQFEVPQGWVRRAVVDTIPAERQGESEYSGNQQWLYCEVHQRSLVPPLSTDVQERLAQRARLALVPPAELDGTEN